MKKSLHIILKLLMTLLLVSPILGAFGLFPEPTRDLYTSDKSFEFIRVLMESGYVMPIMALCFALCIVLFWTKREALAALILLPFTINIVAFHLFLDGGLLTPGAIMADVLLLLNIYYLYRERHAYQPLLKK